jgi:hypothetical protein
MKRFNLKKLKEAEVRNSTSFKSQAGLRRRRTEVKVGTKLGLGEMLELISKSELKKV